MSMNKRRGTLRSCDPFLELEDVIYIDVNSSFSDIIEKLVSLDCFIVSGKCNDPDISLVAFLARLLDKEVCWTGERPKGLLSYLVTGKLE